MKVYSAILLILFSCGMQAADKKEVSPDSKEHKKLVINSPQRKSSVTILVNARKRASVPNISSFEGESCGELLPRASGAIAQAQTLLLYAFAHECHKTRLSQSALEDIDSQLQSLSQHIQRKIRDAKPLHARRTLSDPSKSTENGSQD